MENGPTILTLIASRFLQCLDREREAKRMIKVLVVMVDPPRLELGTYGL